jgi:hypothetical protein
MRVGIIDLLGKEPPRNPYSRFMRANNTSVMTQVVAVWCEEEGHRVSVAYYSGWQLLAGGLPDDVRVVFFNSFSQTALVAYAMSAKLRAAGVVTVLGGAHARSYPEDARRYFDYVVGFCDEQLIRDILQDPSPCRPDGHCLSAMRHPPDLPGLARRWKFLLPAMERASLLRLVPMIGSLGCPYACSFCVDAEIAYQPLNTEVLKTDLRFFQKHRLPRSIIAWHDPNFGVRFDDFLGAIEEAVRPGSVGFLAESSLSLLGESHLKRLAANGFKVIAPGIESWFGIGEKAQLRKVLGEEKVRRVAEKVNLIHHYIPYVQCNLIFGLDCDEGPDPFELTKLFVDLAPGIFPYFSVLTCFGRNAPDNLAYQKSGRVLPVPFHFLDLLQAMNVQPKHYGWTEFYDHLCGVFEHAFSARAITRRFLAGSANPARVEQAFRGLSAERRNRLQYHRRMRRWMKEPEMRAFFDGETREIPQRFAHIIRSHLGPLWQWLPPGALEHDPDAFAKSTAGAGPGVWMRSPSIARANRFPSQLLGQSSAAEPTHEIVRQSAR